MTILKQFEWGVAQEGELVKLRLGNVVIDMDYPTALQMANAMRFQGKKAKKYAGDTSTHYSLIAELSDAELNVRAEQVRRFV